MTSYEVVIILVLGFFSLSCNCSRQIYGKAAAELQHITEDHRQSQETYNSGEGPSNHDGLMIGETQFLTKLGDERVEKTQTSEMSGLSWKRRQLNAVPSKKKMSHGNSNNKLLKGSEALDSFNINVPPKLQEAEKTERSLMKAVIIRNNVGELKSKRRFLSKFSESGRILSSSQSTSLHRDDEGGKGIMEMDYSPAHKRPPIHNKVLSP